MAAWLDMSCPPVASVGSFQLFSQPVIVSISGLWAALIFSARAVALAGAFCFLRITSLISTARE